MRFSAISSLLPALVLLSVMPVATADEKPPAEPTMKELDGWVEQLGHSRLTKRVQAKKKLLRAGKTAIPSLAKAALSDQREAIERSINILGELAQSKEEPTADAARVTLQMLSESEQPSTAARAKQMLNTKAADGIQPFAGWDKPGNEFAGGGRNRSVSVSSVNGVRTIKVIEDGQETLIEEVPRRGIRVRMQQGEETEQFTVRDAAELKKRAPAAHALYQQYTNGNGAMPGFGQGGVFSFANGMGGNLKGGPFFGGLPMGEQKANGNPAKASGNLLLRQQLEELKRRMAGNPAMQQLLDQQIEALSKK